MSEGQPQGTKGGRAVSATSRTTSTRPRRGAGFVQTAPELAPASSQHRQSRGYAILHEATLAGYLGGEKSERVGGRVSPKLLAAAKAKSGIASQTELLEYALSKVALEDDYGPTLLSMKGSIPDDVAI